jgi:hypothetical protein
MRWQEVSWDNGQLKTQLAVPVKVRKQINLVWSCRKFSSGSKDQMFSTDENLEIIEWVGTAVVSS